MNSPWHNSLPVEKETGKTVVVYFYSDRWIPILCFSRKEAIALSRKALLKNKKILVFPRGLDIETQNILSTQSPDCLNEFGSGFV
ncbi:MULTISPECIES: hypothetical protein [unclassified Coleofasciculus]|uniref:hypothetical protein n=1 Tax=unclassified Coleofasciculus TaxID=2692782 RepID=UPI001882E07A|nr:MULTISPECIES: hypothetical protein [unclassified Coleofasciculus]MBE9126879.1 hypothetical protein [Coleofasciculus sp. LEGE 07081]MBE9150244.1 hypothetical protein [Coleofasciculus sp. LEGE 07092]